MWEHKTESKSRLLAMLIRELIRTEKFEAIPDLTEALKCRCARLRIRWTNDDLGEAFGLIASNTPLPGTPARRRGVERPADPEIFDRRTAARLLSEMPDALKAMAPARWADPDDTARELEDARLRALEMGIEL